MKKNLLIWCSFLSMSLFFLACSAPQQDKAAYDAKVKLALDLDKCFETGNTDVLNDILTADFHTNTPDPSFEGNGIEHVKQMIAAYKASSPDMKVSSKRILVDGDYVMNYYNVSGTNTGESMGMPPTGKSWSADGVDLLRIKDGKIAEHWGLFDNYSFMSQLGLIPPMEAPPADTTAK